MKNKLIHISHSDLDGYTCQYISKQIFNNAIYYNSEYSQIRSYLELVLDEIKTYLQDGEVFLLITDINLTNSDSFFLDKKINELNSKEPFKVKLQLLDHHATGQESSEKYEWYFLDNDRSASKITYDYFKEHYQSTIFDDKSFNLLIESVNAYDIWIDDSEHFEFGKVLSRVVEQAREIDTFMFAHKAREYKMHLLNKATAYLNQPNGHIKLDDELLGIKKQYLSIFDTPQTIDNITSAYIVKLLEQNKDVLEITYKDKKGLFTYCLGPISILANLFLKQNPDYDFFINLSRRGSFSLRSDNKIDVSKLAKDLAGGGGHINASGGFFKGFRDSVNFNDIKDFVQEKFDTLSYGSSELNNGINIKL